MTVSLLPGERPALFTFFMRDIAEQKRAASERDRLQAELAQSQKMQAVGQLVSGVAHELNNPLAAIMAFAEDMMADQRDDGDREALGVIGEQALRARSIVRDLLTFVRKNEAEERAQVEPGELIRTVARSFGPQMERAGVALESEAPQLPALVVSRTGIEQVLTNLVANAVQAAGPGGRVRVAARRAGGWCELVVEDSGAGIPAEVMPRLFEPFFTTRPPGQGTGLGLAVAHGIVEQHQGRIVAENRAEGGARFVVALPLPGVARASTPPKSPPVALPQRDSGESQAPNTARRRVLVIDDERTIRVALRRYFERRGWELDEAEDGRAGCERLLGVDGGTATSRPYDVIICDLKMPGMSGIELHRRLETERPELLERLLFSTGDTASAEAAVFLDRTRCPVLEKPFELLALATAVDRLCAAEPSGGSRRAALSSI
jgi:CheY-like chemotaxis protein